MNNILINLQGLYKNELELTSFSNMLTDLNQCYKLYWLEGIVKLVAQDREEITFDEIINEMICSAWYPVKEYQLKLGPATYNKSLGKDFYQNFLESVILTLTDVEPSKNNQTKEEILQVIQKHSDLIKEYKKKLTNHVPYRLLSSF